MGSKSGKKASWVYLDKEDAVVLGTNMYGQNNWKAPLEFMAIHGLNPVIKTTCFTRIAILCRLESHLTFDSLGKRVKPEWRWAWQMQNRCLMVPYKDTELCEHAHIAINRIDMAGEWQGWVDSFGNYRGKEIVTARAEFFSGTKLLLVGRHLRIRNAT